MATLIVKVLLALFALLTAVLGFSDAKSLEPKDVFNPSQSLRQRMTLMGYARLGSALVTFALLALSESLSYSNLKESDAKIKDQSEQARTSAQRIVELKHEVDEAKQAIVSGILEIRHLSASNRNLVTSLDGAVVRAGTVEVPEDKIEGTVDLVFRNGDKLIPKNGDRFDWTISCLSSLPPLKKSEEGDDCRASGYGFLVGPDKRIALDSLSSHRTYSSRSSGAQLQYEPPYCLSTSSSLKESHCSIEIDVMREVRWKYEELQEHDKSHPGLEVPVEALGACRTYEALYGERCEDIR